MAHFKRQPDCLWSWLVCCASFITLTIGNGSCYCFGLLMPSLMEHFKQSNAATAWSGSLYMSIGFLIGPLATHLSQRFGFRITAIGGSLLVAIGFCVSSFANNFWFFFIAFSVPTGFGHAASYSCSVLVVLKHFVKWRSLAVGITASSSSVGMFMMSQITQALLSKYGWRGALRGWALLFLLTALCASTYDPIIRFKEEITETERQQAKRRPPGINCSSLLQNGRFLVYLSSLSLVFFATYTPSVFLVKFSESDLGIPGERVTVLYTYMAIAFFFSIHLFCKLSEFKFFNIFYLYQFSMTAYGIGLILLPFARTYKALVVSYVMFGLMDGGRVGLMPLLVLKCVDQNQTDRAWGLLVFFLGASVAVGPTIIGLIADVAGSYGPAFWSAGAVMIAGSSFMFLIRCVKVNTEPRAKLRTRSSSEYLVFERETVL